MQNNDVKEMGWKAVSKRGVVAGGGAEAVAAGIEILAAGGNAIDAAVATTLALNVTDHGECSIGGEAPMLIYNSQAKTVKSLSGTGRAPLSPEAIAWYMAHSIPKNDIKMAPVPAVIDVCITALQQYGTKSFAEVVSPAVALLDAGEESWHANLAHTLRRLIDSETTATGSRQAHLQAVTDHFYGRNNAPDDIANELEAFYIKKGGFLRRTDLAAHKTLIEDPLSLNYKDHTIYKCGPWTQGPCLAQTLRLLEGFNLKEMGHLSADYVHVAIEALKLALADRDSYYGDPLFVAVPLAELLSDAYTELRRPLIDMQQASLLARPGDPHNMKALKEGGVFRPGVGGTTTCIVADSWGNVVAVTPSANVHLEGGSGKSGVSYGNRLLSFNTTPGHPNCIQAGKRPRITLSPTLVLKDNQPVLAISVAGGDLQDQTTLNLLLNFIEFDLMPAEAVSTPRFATTHHQHSFTPNPIREQTFVKTGGLSINSTFNESVRAELAQRGHELEIKNDPIGRPVMLYADPISGAYYAAGDPLAGRHTAGLD